MQTVTRYARWTPLLLLLLAVSCKYQFTSFYEVVTIPEYYIGEYSADTDPETYYILYRDSLGYMKVDSYYTEGDELMNTYLVERPRGTNLLLLYSEFPEFEYYAYLVYLDWDNMELADLEWEKVQEIYPDHAVIKEEINDFIKYDVLQIDDTPLAFEVKLLQKEGALVNRRTLVRK